MQNTKRGKAPKRILFLGASITQGKISTSYVKILRHRLGKQDFQYINRGVAGYESYNVLKKLEKEKAVLPDIVVLLVGTNDVLSSMDPKLAKLTRKLKHIPHDPDLVNYTRNISAIISYLKQKDGVKIAIASLPPIGENSDSDENRCIAQYNNSLEEVSARKKVSYLPVNEKMSEYLIERAGGKGKDYPKSSKAAYRALIQHFLLFMSLDRISVKNGYHLLTDGIHLNSAGARIIADLTENFILNT